LDKRKVAFSTPRLLGGKTTDETGGRQGHGNARIRRKPQFWEKQVRKTEKEMGCSSPSTKKPEAVKGNKEFSTVGKKKLEP